MKKSYLLLSFIFLFVGAFSAQTNLPTINPQPIQNWTPQKAHKTVSCVDTNQYATSKLTGQLEIDTMDLVSYISGAAQAFYIGGAGFVSGINTYVLIDTLPSTASPLTMTIKVYDIDVNNDIANLVDSTNVQVMDVGYNPQVLMFSSPIAVTDSFAVSIELNSSFPANPFYVTNTSANGDGNQEKLSSVEYLGDWYNAYDDFGGWDMDIMLEPLIVGASVNFGVNHLGGGAYQFFDSTSSFLSGYTYSWDFGDGSPLDTTQNPTHTYSTANSYTVCLTVSDSSGCAMDSMCTVVNFVVGVDEVKASKEIAIYPIPAKNYFDISFPQNYIGGNVIITDVVGKTLQSISIDDQHKMRVLTNQLVTGIYFVSVDHNGNRVFSQRIAVEK